MSAPPPGQQNAWNDLAFIANPNSYAHTTHGYGIICGAMTTSTSTRRNSATTSTADAMNGLVCHDTKRLYLIAGANGSGKSTVAKVFLPAEGVEFVNPDDIAKELSPGAPEKARVAAGKESLRRIGSLLSTGTSVAIETTLSGIVHVKTLKRAKELGYETTIIYVFVSSPSVCIARIASRVMLGGHYIPDEDVRRRYLRSKRNFMNIYAPLADQWSLFYNGSSQTDIVARKSRDDNVVVFSQSLYEIFKEGL